MFCYQCEQTDKGVGCQTDRGVCGKDNETAILQDVLLKVAQSVSLYAHELRKKGIIISELDQFVVEALFTTVTNVNFDPKNITHWIVKGTELKLLAKKKYEEVMGGSKKSADITFTGTQEELVRSGESLSILNRIQEKGADATGLEELIIYGLKGMVAYADHALALGAKDDDVFAFTHELLSFLAEDHDINELLTMAMRVGEMNLKVMEMLSVIHTDSYGHPVPTEVLVTPIKGKAILISGHDLKDLEVLLKQTEGKGINIYTHGEMLPAHGYPELKKYRHLVGNYGGAWQDQKKEFKQFPGAILMTTNCLQEPQAEYKHRIFTCGLVEWPHITHIGNRDFTPVIQAALKETGFSEDQSPQQKIMVGFGHNAVLGVADKVIDAVKTGAIRHFFLIGGCDGAKSGRNYYTHFAEMVPNDCVVLTLACGKYRFNKRDFGTIGGIPRLLDIGQCNDAYSAIQIAVALSKAFNTDVNGLPLSFIISWYEQKAVAVLLTLLYLGVKNIHLGPTLPAFISPAALQVLVDKFQLKAGGKAEEDLGAILGSNVG